MSLYFVAGPYTEGRQPCERFRSRDELADRGARGNVHECFGPYDGRPSGCSGTVSFCDSCNHDHHSGGWDACGTVEEIPKPCPICGAEPDDPHNGEVHAAEAVAPVWHP